MPGQTTAARLTLFAAAVLTAAVYSPSGGYQPWNHRCGTDMGLALLLTGPLAAVTAGRALRLARHSPSAAARWAAVAAVLVMPPVLAVLAAG